MTEEKKKSFMDEYLNIFKFWTDMAKYWADYTNLMDISKIGSESFLTPVMDYFNSWNKMYERFIETIKNVYPFHMGIDTYTDTLVKGVDSYIKVYDTWIKGMDKIFVEGYRVMSGIATGKETDVKKIISDMEDYYKEVYESFIKMIEAVPFIDVNIIKDSFDKFTGAFSEEQERMREFQEKYLTYIQKTIKDWNETVRIFTKSMVESIEKGEFSTEIYQKLIGMYNETYVNFLESLKPLLDLDENLAKDIIDWNQKYFNMISAWLEIPLKMFDSINKNYKELIKYITEVDKEEITSPEKLQEKWAKFYQDFAKNFVQKANVSNTIPKFIDSMIDYIKTTNKFFTKYMPPYVTKKDVTKAEEETKPTKKTETKK
ncbi:hypothetical protein [Candidatus Methanoliparum sp. LAM-1]|uniref:hypothetical protein n=1 Tax=Candidatus Methanoliparum sp. LAM-1 TaxID=2874846 RepID=UPI001E519697|nr:hypothetical protein [Candidatus Methanoliparum sp. LAM-1]BDC36332.1 hypothetical protein MTLP_10140 [Candidatus Methanoliparum sp. LAM-1]